MTRRDAIVILIGAGYTGRYLVAQEIEQPVSKGEPASAGTVLFDPNVPRDLTWSLGGLRNFIVIHGDGRKVVIPVEDVWQALQGEKA